MGATLPGNNTEKKMRTTTLIAAPIAAALLAMTASALAAEFAESVCREQASAEGWEDGDALCSCLADKVASDPALGADLGGLQAASPEDRTPENFSEAVAAAVEACAP